MENWPTFVSQLFRQILTNFVPCISIINVLQLLLTGRDWPNTEKKTADGSYILNGADLLTYPVEVALLDGAEEISLEEAKKLLNKPINEL